MKRIIYQRLAVTAGLAAGVLSLALALGGFAGGCEDSGSSSSGSDKAGSGGTSAALPQVPPIDLTVPSDTATASFALG